MVLTSKILEGKVAIVTGASRGIGQAVTKKLAENGATVYAVSRTVDKNTFYDNLVIQVCADITDNDAISALFRRVFSEQHRLDILVNNAGIMTDALIGMITEKQVNDTFSVNVFAPIFLTQYAAKLMRRHKSGSIINMASIMGITGNRSQLVYAASKGAIIAMTKSAAKELAMDGIRVNALAPGVISTNLIAALDDEKIAAYKAKIAMKRFGTSEEVAEAVLFFASDHSRYISGQILGIDGMMSN